MNPRTSRTASQLIFATLALIGLYVLLVEAGHRETYASLEQERKRRLEAEERSRAAEKNLDGALAKIHELNPESGGE